MTPGALTELKAYCSEQSADNLGTENRLEPRRTAIPAMTERRVSILSLNRTVADIGSLFLVT